MGSVAAFVSPRARFRKQAPLSPALSPGHLLGHPSLSTWYPPRPRIKLTRRRRPPSSPSTSCRCGSLVIIQRGSGKRRATCGRTPLLPRVGDLARFLSSSSPPPTPLTVLFSPMNRTAAGHGCLRLCGLCRHRAGTGRRHQGEEDVRGLRSPLSPCSHSTDVARLPAWCPSAAARIRPAAVSGEVQAAREAETGRQWDDGGGGHRGAGPLRPAATRRLSGRAEASAVGGFRAYCLTFCRCCFALCHPRRFQRRLLSEARARMSGELPARAAGPGPGSAGPGAGAGAMAGAGPPPGPPGAAAAAAAAAAGPSTTAATAVDDEVDPEEDFGGEEFEGDPDQAAAAPAAAYAEDPDPEAPGAYEQDLGDEAGDDDAAGGWQ